MVIMCSLLCIIEDNFQIQAPGGLYSEGLIVGVIFAFQIWGAYTRRSLFSEFYCISWKPRLTSH